MKLYYYLYLNVFKKSKKKRMARFEVQLILKSVVLKHFIIFPLVLNAKRTILRA